MNSLITDCTVFCLSNSHQVIMFINDFNKVIILLLICSFCQFKWLWKHHTWSSLMNWARMKLCLSLLDWAVSTSGITLWIGGVLCSTGPSKWQSKPMLPGNWKRLSWGPNGPMVSSGHTVLCAIHRNIKHTSLENTLRKHKYKRKCCY